VRAKGERRKAKIPRAEGAGAYFRFSLFALLICLPGCLERTVTVTSDPPGALVSLNDVEVGRTPVETAFLFYGDYDVRLRREGNEPLIAHKEIDPPVYEWIPFDLLATVLPLQIRARQMWHFRLEPTPPMDEAAEAALMSRARTLGAQLGASPAPAR